MKTYLIFGALVSFVVAVAACDDSNQVIKPKGVLYSGNNSESESTFGVIHSVNYLNATDSQDVAYVNAVLGGDSSENVVKFEGNALPLMAAYDDSTTRVYQQIYNQSSSPMSLDGNYYTFSTSGNWGGSFTDSLQGPGGRIAITSHFVGDTVSSSGFTVTWTPASGAQSSAVGITDTSSGGTHSCGTKYAATDGGSATFSAADLSCLAHGPVWITISRARTKSDSVASGKYYSIILRNQLRIPLFLN
jgi:hypothetical protein